MRNRKGSTLIEVMVSVAGLSVLLTAVMGIYGMSVKTFNKESDRNQANGSALWALEYVKRDVRNASLINSSYNSHITSGSKLILEAPSYTNSGMLNASIDHIVYSVTPQKTLVRDTYAVSGSNRKNETARPLARNVKSIGFVYKVHDSFTGDGSNRTFTLSSIWTSLPTVLYDGASIDSFVTYNPALRTAQLSYIPANGAVIEFVYPVDPSNTSALANVSEVNLTVTVEEPGSGDLRQFTTIARMRNRQ